MNITKGVICHIAEDHEMPVDAAGNRVDIVMDRGARVSRSNLGGLLELHTNASSRDMLKRLRGMLDVPPLPWPANYKSNVGNHPNFEAAWEVFLRFIEIATPVTAEEFRQPEFQRHRASYLDWQLAVECVFLHYQPNNPRETRDLVTLLEAEFPSTYGPVTYTGYSGKQCTTKAKVRVGSMYILLLEKTGDDWTAVSSGKWQSFGVLAPIVNRDKYAQPTRTQPIRATGETEARIKVAYAGPLYVAELLDRSNNFQSHNILLDAILQAPQPSAIPNAIDRTYHQLGNCRPLQLVKHYLLCAGMEYVYAPHQPNVMNELVDDEV